MATLNKLFVSTLVLAYFALGTACVYGQNRITNTGKKKKALTIGVAAGKDLFYQPGPGLFSKHSSPEYATNHTLFARKSITKHVKVEAGINYRTSVTATGNKLPDGTAYQANKTSKLTLPLTIQYYLLPEHSKVNTFVGAGPQVNLLNNASYGYPPFSSDIRTDKIPQRGTKYISVLITQGVTFQINTKIQLTETLHFSPANAGNIVGIDIGVGFYLE